MGEGSARIDTIRVGGRITAVNVAVPGWTVTSETTAAGRSEVGRRMRLPSGAMLDVRAGTAWVEGSVPKLLHGANYPAASGDEAYGAAVDWLDEACELVRWDPDDRARVNRLDVPRDFDLGDPVIVSGVISGIAAVPVIGRGRKAHYEDGTANRAQTTSILTRRSGGGRLYDKGRESGQTEALGVLRFEAEERVNTLKRSGLTHVEHLRDSAKVYDLGRRRFDWCGFGAQLLSPEDFYDRVMSLPGIIIRTRIILLGYAEIVTRSGSVSNLFESRKTDYRYRRMIREIGVPATVGSVRLDYDEGLVKAA